MSLHRSVWPASVKIYKVSLFVQCDSRIVANMLWWSIRIAYAFLSTDMESEVYIYFHFSMIGGFAVIMTFHVHRFNSESNMNYKIANWTTLRVLNGNCGDYGLPMPYVSSVFSSQFTSTCVARICASFYFWHRILNNFFPLSFIIYSFARVYPTLSGPHRSSTPSPSLALCLKLTASPVFPLPAWIFNH